MVDDWHCGKGSAEYEKDYRGILMLIMDENSCTSYTLWFNISTGKSNECAKDDVLKVIKDYDLENEFGQGLIPVLTDHALQSAMAAINPLASTCSVHSINCILRRTLKVLEQEDQSFNNNYKEWFS